MASLVPTQNDRRFCGWRRAAIAVVTGVLVATCAQYVVAAPNIVVILVDDMGFSDLGCYGSEIDTPNIDRLAARGQRFTQFYNCGRCCPTRASLMTGLHPHQTGIGHMTEPPNQPLGITGPYQGYLNDNCVTIAQALQTAGYHTLMTGKWHLGIQRKECWPTQRGFDEFYGCLSGAINYFQPAAPRGLTRNEESEKPPEDFYATDAFTDEACRMISQVVKQDDRPFFLYLAYNAPHWPLNAKEEEFRKYRGKYRDGWTPMMARRVAKQKELGLFDAALTPAPHEGPPWDSLRPRKRDDLDAIMAAYAGCVDSIDQNVGRLIAHLEQLHELDDTVLLFLSDNGACQEGGRLGKGSEQMVLNPPLRTVDGVHLGQAWANACNTPFRLYKHFLHEGGACTPLIAVWPAEMPTTSHGSFVRDLAYLPDVMATCLDLAQAEYPADKPSCVGKSFAGVLRGEAGPIHDEPLFWEHEGNASMRDGPWKLVRRYQQPWELYNLDDDRTELVNLAEQHPQRLAEMRQQWETWATATGVSFPERFDMYQHLRQRSAKAP